MCKNITAEKIWLSELDYKFSTFIKDGPDNYSFQKVMWLRHFLWVVGCGLWNLLGNLWLLPFLLLKTLNKVHITAV